MGRRVFFLYPWTIIPKSRRGSSSLSLIFLIAPVVVSFSVSLSMTPVFGQ